MNRMQLERQRDKQMNLERLQEKRKRVHFKIELANKEIRRLTRKRMKLERVIVEHRRGKCYENQDWITLQDQLTEWQYELQV